MLKSAILMQVRTTLHCMIKHLKRLLVPQML